ncbi:MAG: hypothetical protein MUF78_10990 [Candidatus Edwardsbacteria bacterium]|nr:hypothetical protein [Candidatus Edwardsbacteria bacterium]
MRILHIAPLNTAGVPIALVQAERALGHDSRLVTLARDPRGYQEDLCLDLPLWDPAATAMVRRMLLPRRCSAQDTGLAKPGPRPPRWRPAHPLAAALFRLRDKLQRPLVEQAIRRHRLDEFDVCQLDGGHGFLKYDPFLPTWHARGKKVVCCYLGSDLRRRGVMPGIDEIADRNVTVEWDHLDLHPDIRHVFFPFDCSAFRVRARENPGRLRIGHSPTDRAGKGSDAIIAAVRSLEKTHPVELVLIEGLSHADALAVKATCDIGVDQLGDLGYGISALEWLAMGVPVASCVAANMKTAGIAHPFVEIDRDSIVPQLTKLITDGALRRRLGAEGRAWLERTHDAPAVVKRIHQLAGISELSTSQT